MSAPITRAEWDAKLKHAQDQAQRATKAELARNYSEAFELYVRAGQLFVWLLGNFPATASNDASVVAFAEPVAAGSSFDGLSGANAAQTRERLKQMATKVMARAEKIKAIRKDLRPVDRDALSQEEQSTILVSSSLINGLRYPIWNGSSTQASKHTQDAQPQLSPVQLRKGALYKRASEVAQAQDQGWTSKLKGSDIVQDIVTDCSFVAALEVAAEHDRLFGGQLATSALYPKDASGRIQPSPSGQYYVKLHINGAPRTVSIDDHLPYYPLAASTADGAASNSSAGQNHRLMCATSRDGQALWPALLEKAYLQIMGGYDFAGSNSSIDLYALTGWLPEHIFLRHAGFQREKTWHRLLAAWRAGKCMATAGTGKGRGNAQSDQDVAATITLESGLISSHNYAILDVLACGSRRFVKLMNPWRTAAGIRPAIAISAEEEHRVYGSNESLDDKLGRITIEANEQEAAVPLTFTVTWDDFCSHFDSLFLNWDPNLFENNVTVHSSWRASSATQSSGLPSRHPDPHFRLAVTLPSSIQGGKIGGPTAADASAEIWLLLARHITNTRSTLNEAVGAAEYIALHAFEDDHQASESGKLASTSAPALYKAKHKGAYVDGTHCLVRLKPPEHDDKQKHQHRSFTIVVSRRSESNALAPAQDVNYTLSVFSRYRMELSELQTRLPYCETVNGAWTARTAGGNATLSSFMSNPQYTLVVPAGAGEVQLQVTLECADRKMPVQVLLAYPGAGTGRVTHLTEGDVVLSSGMYHHGLALCSTSRPGAVGAQLRPGTYTLIASTFEAGMHGDFTLRVEATRPVTLKPIPQEGAGMFHRRLVSSWKRGVNACGSPANKAYLSNPGWRFSLERTGGVVARIKVETVRSSDGVRPYVNLALFAEDGALSEVASSGSYTDLTCGAAVERAKLRPGTYRLVASTYQPEVEAEFAVELYTTAKVDVVAV
ncbi:related to calpain-like protease PalBory [Sporisorium reilianum SRZ2]|uniref:Related to calpain-like protease PalBory n=1 Tax=Sporisorium reilianum (strain SRZ2) TaxID=999809 RepID=E6ZZD6_SPORE|nr:related to calpain-like protease PalBory [Sporisorium reilianum SRZ2]